MASLAVSLLMIIMAMAISILKVRAAPNGEYDIGVNYGMLGDNLPPAHEVVQLLKQYGITKMRLFDPNHDALEALRGSGLLVSLGVRNEDIPSIGSSPDAAYQWYAAHIQPYQNDIHWAYITVGNEINLFSPDPMSTNLVPAMKNIRTVLNNNGLQNLFVTTVLAANVLGVSYPPSAGDFAPAVKPIMLDILTFLSTTNAPLMVNLYPYFAYAGDPVHISLEYALFNASEPPVVDGALKYYNLLDAMTDAFTYAIERQGIMNVGLTVAESGWPSAGNGQITTPELAQIYNRNFVNHILNRVGTPKRPGAYVDAFIFAIFNENQKPPGVEQNWGLYYPSLQPVYSLF
ncbi:OLC1v1021782C1 [Oldenlandia corymbosa var. corymbosa]|uniref:OLC1v1021782C1 n=1 Tax=Oldenlandia corymbosa var. corymbosa TaxID=529605 RepID=A0AAV1BXY3_OLDCO|nr:OLC1v1021782C1 [Oldenlandia corymbosa var. corymbosa]